MGHSKPPANLQGGRKGRAGSARSRQGNAMLVRSVSVLWEHGRRNHERREEPRAYGDHDYDNDNDNEQGRGPMGAAGGRHRTSRWRVSRTRTQSCSAGRYSYSKGNRIVAMLKKDDDARPRHIREEGEYEYDLTDRQSESEHDA